MKNKGERKNKEKKREKMLKKLVILNLAAILFIVLIMNTNILIYPSQGMQTTNTTINFAWLGFASHAVIDDNPEFTSPTEIEKFTLVELEPGRYYWCVPFFAVCLQKSSFTIESEVSIVGKEIQASEENATYYLENIGNTANKIEVRNLLGRLITGLFILEPKSSEIVKINETVKIIATQR